MSYIHISTKTDPSGREYRVELVIESGQLVERLLLGSFTRWNLAAMYAPAVGQVYGCSRIVDDSVRPDDEQLIQPTDEWRISLSRPDGKVHLTRYWSGFPNESHRPMTPAEATIAIASVLGGFEPPRGLVRLDTDSANST